MPLPTLGDLVWLPALDHPELLARTTFAALTAWARVEPAVSEEAAVAPIDPALADTAALTEAHRLPIEAPRRPAGPPAMPAAAASRRRRPAPLRR